MPDNIFSLSQFYDFIELLGLDEDIEATPREEISIPLQWGLLALSHFMEIYGLVG